MTPVQFIIAGGCILALVLAIGLALALAQAAGKEPPSPLDDREDEQP